MRQSSVMVPGITNMFYCRGYKLKYKSVEEGSKAEEFQVSCDEENSGSVTLNVQVSSDHFLSEVSLVPDISRTV